MRTCCPVWVVAFLVNQVGTGEYSMAGRLARIRLAVYRICSFVKLDSENISKLYLKGPLKHGHKEFGEHNNLTKKN